MSISKQLCNEAFKFHPDECFEIKFQAFDNLLTLKNDKINDEDQLTFKLVISFPVRKAERGGGGGGVYMSKLSRLPGLP